MKIDDFLLWSRFLNCLPLHDVGTSGLVQLLENIHEKTSHQYDFPGFIRLVHPV